MSIFIEPNISAPKLVFMTTSFYIILLALIAYSNPDYIEGWGLIPLLAINTLFMITHAISGFQLSNSENVSERISILLTGVFLLIIAISTNKIILIYTALIMGLFDVIIGFRGAVAYFKGQKV